MGLRPLEHVRWKFFIAVAIKAEAWKFFIAVAIKAEAFIEAVNYCSEYLRCCRSSRSASDDSILSYYTKATLTSLMSEFLQ